ncbi:hypothetical protein [Rhizobium sp. N324]|uniref:hypothetical protein n=1 Tax=Rhizobium sp. N324 TaxID=1703969 RepID=UPI0007E933DD|nr:hypothetical protein [Rhizobium sp. N324]ANM12090.1 hypothetical protein AMK05_CH03741 [Rhizobium sp. N324]
MTDLLQRVAENVQEHMDAILKNFKPDAKITVLVRFPDKPTADFCMTGDDLDAVADMVERRRASVTPQAGSRLRSEFVPGAWRCPKCNFRLLQSNLNAADGTVTARDTPGDKCPNCAAPLWRVSWKDEAQENLSIAENQLERALAAERKLAEALEVIRPFAREAATWTAEAPDDYQIKVKLATKVIQSKLTVGHVRAAGSLLQKENGND